MIGVLAMLLAMALMPLSDAVAKYLVADFPAAQVSLFRNLAHAAALLPVVLIVHGAQAIGRACTFSQILRAACFVLMTVCYVAGLKRVPLAESMATVFLFPALVLVGSRLFFGEQVGTGRWAAALVGFLGVLVVAGATFADTGRGLLFILAAAFFTAAYMLMTKATARATPTLILGLLPALIGSGFLLVPGMAGWVEPDVASVGLMCLVGLIAAVSHLLIVFAYAQADASLIAPLAYAQIVMATLYGALIFGDWPAGTTWIGIAIIVVSGAVLATQERRLPMGTTGRR